MIQLEKNTLRILLKISFVYLVKIFKQNYQVGEIVRVAVEKTFNVKSYHKINKNRSQVEYKKFDNCGKLSYTVNGKPSTFQKKF